MKSVGARKRARFERLRQRIDEVGQDTLEGRYSEYLAGAREALDRAGIGTSRDRAGLRTSRRKQRPSADPCTLEPFRNFMRRLKDNLASPIYIERLCDPYIESVMPEIWQDEEAYRRFLESFFGYVAFFSEIKFGGNGTKKPHGLVPTQILKRSGCWGSTATETSIKEGLERYLATTGWHWDDWPIQ